jgi:hypothetical protein
VPWIVSPLVALKNYPLKSGNLYSLVVCGCAITHTYSLLYYFVYRNLETEPLCALMTAIQQIGCDPDSSQNDEDMIPYNPATVLFLEFMVTIATRNLHRIDLIW